MTDVVDLAMDGADGAQPSMVGGRWREAAGPWARRAAWVGVRVAAVVMVVWLVHAGLEVRDWLWTSTVPMRFRGDIANGLNQGLAVVNDAQHLAGNPKGPLTWPQFLRGYLQRYDRQVQEVPDQRYSLDYTPARLLTMSIWAWHVKSEYPKVGGYEDVYAVPLLELNTVCELSGAVLMFLLVHHWLRRRTPAMPAGAALRMPQGPPALTRSDLPWILAVVAGLIFWFNPSTLVDAHAWPQWDVWLIPFFLAALYLASCEWWFAAGAMLVVGAMLKGQLLVAAPVMILWPLMMGRVGAAVRLVIGGLFTTAVLMSPWLMGTGWMWVGVIVAIVAAQIVAARRGDWLSAGVGGWIAAAAVLAVIAEPWLTREQSAPWLVCGVAGALVLATPWVARRCGRLGSAMWLALLASGAIALASDVFGGSWSWWNVGFLYGAERYQFMASGGVGNLAEVLANGYGWQTQDIAFSLPLKFHGWVWHPTIKVLLSTMYGTLLAVCAWGAARHAKRGDVRALVGLTAPWVLLFTMLPQMHTRYLMWSAAVAGVGVAVSLELLLLQVLLIFLSVASLLGTMLASNGGPKSHYPGLWELLRGINGHTGWMMLLVAAIYVYQSVVGKRRAEVGISADSLSAG